MIPIDTIYEGAEKIINKFLREEAEDQGHTLTGAMGRSFAKKLFTKGREKIMRGMAVKYTDYVNDGFPAKSASMKQFPFVKEFFIKRGLSEEEAGGAAAATIRKWMKEGMSTQASKRFSKTGARQNFIESAFIGGEVPLNRFMEGQFNASVDQEYRKTKSETV